MRELKETNIEILKGFKIKAIVGTATVEALELLDSRGNEQALKINGVFITSPKARLDKVLTESGLQTDDKGCIQVDSEMQTNIEGVYAAGDCTCGGLQVSTSVGEGVKAALSIFRSLRRMTRS